METTFGPALTRYRTGHPLSMIKLGKRSGVDYTTISRLERGERHPSRTTVVRLADALYLDRAGKDALLAAAGFAGVDPGPVEDDPLVERVKALLAIGGERARTRVEHALALLED